MTTKTDLRIQNLTSVASALSTLTANEAIIINTELGTALGRSFLMKKLKLSGLLSTVDAADGNMCMGLARGDATVAEIAAAMNEFNASGPEDTTESLTEDEVWTVIQKSVVWAKQGIQTSDTKHDLLIVDEISFGRGIPAIEDQGVSIFVYNGGPSLTTGALASVHAQLWGVWLND